MQEFRFDQLWPVLRSTVEAVHACLLDAIDGATRLDTEHPEFARDGIRWAQNVRAYLAANLSVEIPDDEVALERGFNLSLTLLGRNTALRILKAQPGKLPQVGNSPGRRDYFAQNPVQPSLPFMLGAERNSPPEFAPNLLLVWGVDEYRQLSCLSLAYPKPTPDDQLSTGGQEWYWVEPVFEHSKPNVNLTGSIFDQPEDLPNVELDDSEIDQDDDQETGTE
jgi:hypothetical protein